MKKKVLAIVLCLAIFATFALGLTACGPAEEDNVLKIGAIMVGDETEGYTKAHMDGINAAVAALAAKGKEVQVIWKKTVEENNECTVAIDECIDAGCSLILSNSYGHQDFMATAAKANPSVTFIAMTGDYAAITTNSSSEVITNFKNAFTDVYEARFVSGVVAGLKLQELVTAGQLTADNYDNGNTATGNIKIGYVGAYSYAEVVSGYTAFYLGVKSVVDNVVMTVKYTNSWFNFDTEKTVATALISQGCVIIGQHADSEGAPTAVEEAYDAGTKVYSVGYNVDMLGAAPDAALTSATNNWEVYYEYAFETAYDGETIVTNWAKGYSDNAVGITTINTDAFTTNPTTAVNTVINNIKDGTVKVFDTSTFTVTNINTADFKNMGVVVDGDKHVTSYNYDMSYKDWSNGGVVVYAGSTVETINAAGYFDESSFRSAPYFDLRIDGITEEAAD